MSIASRTTWDEIPHFRLVSKGDSIRFISSCKLGIKKIAASVCRFRIRYRSGSDTMDSLINTSDICASPEIDLAKSAS
jgi:hypothetical protein